MNRRTALASIVGGVAISHVTSAMPAKKNSHLKLCFNVSTIRGQNLGFRKELEITAKAGFKHVEIWINNFQEYLAAGNSLADVKRLLNDLDLTPENAIGFAPWIIEDTQARKKGLDQLKKEMDQLKEIGCKRIASPPMGATNDPKLSLNDVASRYRDILLLGDQTGVVPQLELWGFSKNLSKLSDVIYVALEANHPSAKVLLDIYHLYKGGNDHSQIKNLGANLIDIFHVNDYPAEPTRDKIVDADRVFTGDGIAPVKQVLTDLKALNNSVLLSLELFNKTYYQQPAQEVATTGYKKLKAIVDSI